MNYFRAILKSGEISQRALDLTTAVVDLNAANYAAWYLSPNAYAKTAALPSSYTPLPHSPRIALTIRLRRHHVTIAQASWTAIFTVIQFHASPSICIRLHQIAFLEMLLWLRLVLKADT